MKHIHLNSDYTSLFGFRNETSTGTSMLLLNTFFSCIANIFITGTFYTGFLTDNGIDIVRVGIITFIPYMAWVFSLFSPKLLSHFKHRRGLLLFNHIFYYTCIVLATTLMPMVVKEPGERTVWFGIFLFAGHTSNALIGSGSMAWHINFIPTGKQRNVYFSLSNLITNILGTTAAIGASLLADSLSGTPGYSNVLVILRLISFVLFIGSGMALFLVPKEYPYPVTQKHYKIKDIFSKPLHSRKFLLTVLIAVFWNFICNFNSSTWNYYILNTVHVPYLMTYLCSIACALGSIFLLHWWRGLVSQYSWFKIMLLAVFVTALLELPMSFTTERTIGIYVVISIIQGLNLVGAQLVFANVFYINLPKTDTDIYITFYNFSINIFVLFGSMLGTGFLSLMEHLGTSWTVFGLPFYSSQFLVWIKFVCLLVLCLYIYRVTPQIKNDEKD